MAINKIVAETAYRIRAPSLCRNAKLAAIAMTEPDDVASALQVQKLQREIEKLEVETRLLNRPWWLQAPYIGAIFPIMAVVVTGWIAYRNSDFRREAQTAKNEIATLRPEADSLKQQVTRLQNDQRTLQRQRDILIQEVKNLDARSQALEELISLHNAGINTWRIQLRDISDRLKSKAFGGGGIQILPPPNAEPERKLLQSVIDSMLSTLDPRVTKEKLPPTKH
jgi:cell division protein FtsB